MNDVGAESPTREPDAVPGRLLALICASTVAFSIVLAVGAALLVKNDIGDRPPAQGERPSTVPEPGTASELLLPARAAVPPLREQAEQARSWGWVDREAGTFHMPLDAAMELWLEQREAVPR